MLNNCKMMKNKISLILFVFAFLYFPFTSESQIQEVKKTEIGTCYCGIDDYKCRAGSGSCNVGSQSICSVDCGDEQ